MIIKTLALIALIGSVIWLIAQPGFEPALAVIAALSALVSAFIVQKRSKKLSKQQQSVSNSSIGIQAGGDVNIGDSGGKNVK